MHLIFWQNMLAMHQSAYLRSLANMGHEVTVVVECELAQKRRKQGFFVPDLGNVRIVTNPDSETIQAVFSNAPKDAIHLVGGVRGYNLGRVAARECVTRNVSWGVVSEGADPRGILGLFRRGVYVLAALQFSQKADFVLAMGDTGAHWYRSCGWPKTKVFPYMYVTERRAFERLRNSAEIDATTFNISFVGQLINRKGVDLLLKALYEIRGKAWRLTIVGDGPGRQKFETMARRLNIADRVYFRAAMPNAEVLKVIGQHDLLVLPSRYDGWGAVVNEALMQGVPVVASDQCGAASLLSSEWRGHSYSAHSVSDLAYCLERAIASGRLSSERLKRIADWSRNIEGGPVAAYLIAILHHIYAEGPVPMPPWCVGD